MNERGSTTAISKMKPSSPSTIIFVRSILYKRSAAALAAQPVIDGTLFVSNTNILEGTLRKEVSTTAQMKWTQIMLMYEDEAGLCDKHGAKLTNDNYNISTYNRRMHQSSRKYRSLCSAQSKEEARSRKCSSECT